MATGTTHKSTLMAGILLALSSFIAPASSDALSIPEFDAMSKEAQGQYVGQLLVNTMQMLWDQKRDADVDKVENLFTPKNGKRSNGVTELMSTIAGLRNPPNGKTYHVEHAFALLLREQGMPLTPDEVKHLAQAGKSFKPSSKAVSHEEAGH